MPTPTQTLANKPPLSIPLPSTPKPPMKDAIAPVPPSPRLPFFEKFKNKLPGVNPTADRFQGIHNSPPRAANSMPAPATNSVSGGTSSSSSSSAGAQKALPNAPSSSASGSDYSGLAYANSTDYEDGDGERRGRKSNLAMNIKSPPLTQAMFRTISTGPKVQFGSVSERSRSNDSVGSGGSRSLSRVRGDQRVNEARNTTHSQPSHSRDNSVSSYSSNADSDHCQRSSQQSSQPRDRSNSFAIAQALGLSQKPPSEYAKLGGPGVNSVEGRIARSASGSSSGTGNRSGYSRGGSEKGEGVPPLPHPKVLEPSSSSLLSKGGSDKSREGTGDKDVYDDDENNVLNVPMVKAQRSNTMQGTSSPDLKTIKLPMRAQSEREKDRVIGDRVVRKEKEQERGKEKEKEKRKYRVCLRCAKNIEDGRWVSSDGGGILCEKCWKNMYLPKVCGPFPCSFEDIYLKRFGIQCRRCNLTIEKQAVSSADGQLKGKYHKECFNCHKCHVRSSPQSRFLEIKPFIFSNPSLTRHSTFTTANLSAPITTTKRTTRSVLRRVAASPSRVPVRCRTRAIGIILST